MNWSPRLAVLVPPGVVTVTSTVPEPAGEVGGDLRRRFGFE